MTYQPGQKYHMTYRVQVAPDGGLTSKEIRELGDDVGGCDALVIISIVLPEDGSYSQAAIGVHGVEERSLTPREMWKAWAVMAHSLFGSLELEEWQGELLWLVHEKTKEHVLDARGKAEEGQKRGTTT